VHSTRPGYSIPEVLDALIGAPEPVVLERLGGPQHTIRTGSTSHFIYTGNGHEYELWLAGWLPIGVGRSERNYCVLLEFDEAGLLQQYRVNYVGEPEVVPDDWCVSLVRNRVPGPALQEALLSAANAGDVTAQWELYRRSKGRGEPAFKWLCAAAEQGHDKARIELGYLHYYGLHGVRRDKGLAYVWYSLAQAGGQQLPWLERLRMELDAAQRARAEELIANRAQGVCAAELPAIGPGNASPE